MSSSFVSPIISLTVAIFMHKSVIVNTCMFVKFKSIVNPYPIISGMKICVKNDHGKMSLDAYMYLADNLFNYYQLTWHVWII